MSEKEENGQTMGANQRGSSGMRSTMPINSFYGQMIEFVRTRNYEEITNTLEDMPHKFYGPIDSMNKTLLH